MVVLVSTDFSNSSLFNMVNYLYLWHRPVGYLIATYEYRMNVSILGISFNLFCSQNILTATHLCNLSGHQLTKCLLWLLLLKCYYSY
jgi:hypothetical protein